MTPPAELGRFRFVACQDELSAEPAIDLPSKEFGGQPKVPTLCNTGEHLRHVEAIAVAHIDLVAKGRGAESGRDPRQRARRGVEQIVETVMPKGGHLEHFRFASAALIAQLLGQVEDPLYVVIVDMADHQDIDGKLFSIIEPACRADLLKARPKMRPVDLGGPAIDHGEARFGLGAIVQQQAVAFAGAQQVEAEQHEALPQID